MLKLNSKFTQQLLSFVEKGTGELPEMFSHGELNDVYSSTQDLINSFQFNWQFKNNPVGYYCKPLDIDLNDSGKSLSVVYYRQDDALSEGTKRLGVSEDSISVVKESIQPKDILFMSPKARFLYEDKDDAENCFYNIGDFYIVIGNQQQVVQCQEDSKMYSKCKVRFSRVIITYGK